MNSYKCPQCGLVNWLNAEYCKRCKLPNQSNQNYEQVADSNQFEGQFQSANTMSYNSSANTQAISSPYMQASSYASTQTPPNFYADRMGSYSMQNTQPLYPPQQIGVNTLCRMCGSQSNNMKKLYEGEVCKVCHRQYISRRQAAFLLDLVVYRGLATLVIVTLFAKLGDSVAMFGFILAIFPILLRDATGGVSLGKLITGLKTIDFATKQPCGVGKSIIRNIILYVPFMLLIELIFIQNGKRLGDRIVDTRVVWKKYENARIFWT